MDDASTNRIAERALLGGVRPSLDPRGHAASLSTLAAAALRDGQTDRALLLADRRCRIGPLPGASDFLLRAAAAAAAGHAEVAAQDLTHALELDPENLVANQWLLKSPLPERRRRAAQTLVRRELRPTVLRQALAALASMEVDAVGQLEPDHAGVGGWFVWRDSGPLELRVTWDGGEACVTVLPDTAHALAEVFGDAADWRFDWPPGACRLEVRVARERCFVTDTILYRPDLALVQKAVSPGAASNSVAVIVPVYRDFAATKACLDALLADTHGLAGHRIILVDDASPDDALKALLSALRDDARVEIIHHSRNRGFARSVNAALRLLSREDAIILNADTVVPPGFVARLRAAAYASDDIGTVTPLSNNGEYTSFPVPFQVNPMPNGKALLEFDRAAASANRGVVVDMPNGTGFCLYVRRACLDAVGPLRTHFGRGYYEDVDLCLRAADAGFRNVCAADVYVAHAGSRSFAGEKRALVVRNLQVIDADYPGYRAASAAFVAADPLCDARAAIERVMLSRAPVRLLVAAATADREAVSLCAQEFAEGRWRVLVATMTLSAGRVGMRLAAADGGMPQSLRFSWPRAEAESEIAAALGQFRVDAVALHEDAALPAGVRRAFEHFGASRRLGAGLVRPNAQTMPGGRLTRNKRRLGILSPGRSAVACDWLVRLCRELAGRRSPEVVVLGATFDDLRVMSAGRVFVTGPLSTSEIGAAAWRYALSHLYVPCQASAELAALWLGIRSCAVADDDTLGLDGDGLGMTAGVLCRWLGDDGEHAGD